MRKIEMAHRTRKVSRKQRNQRKQRKQQGGNEDEQMPLAMPPAMPVASEGGKRRSRKLSPWNKFVQKIYKEMKSQNKSATFGEALKAASKRKKEM